MAKPAQVNKVAVDPGPSLATGALAARNLGLRGLADRTIALYAPDVSLNFPALGGKHLSLANYYVTIISKGRYLKQTQCSTTSATTAR